MDLWSTVTGGEPVHHYQTPRRIQALALSPDSPVLGSTDGSEVRLDGADDRGYWRTLCRAQLPNFVRLHTPTSVVCHSRLVLLVFECVKFCLNIYRRERKENDSLNKVLDSKLTHLHHVTGGEPGPGSRQGAAAPASSLGGRRSCVPVGPSGGGAKDDSLSLWASCHLPGRLRIPCRVWGEAHRLGDARRRQQGGSMFSL